MKVEHPYLLGATVLAFLAYVLYQRSVQRSASALQGTDLYGPGMGSTSASIPNIVVTPNNIGTSS